MSDQLRWVKWQPDAHAWLYDGRPFEPMNFVTRTFVAQCTARESCCRAAVSMSFASVLLDTVTT